MDFLYKNNTLSIESEKKTIEFHSESINLDGLILEMAGEYEKWGFLAYCHDTADNRIYQLRAEGYSIGYLPTIVADLTAPELDFLGDLDVLIMPTGKGSIALIEKIEPRMIVTYGETAHELATHMGISEPPVLKYRLKEADLSGERMGCVVMGE